MKLHLPALAALAATLLATQAVAIDLTQLVREQAVAVVVTGSPSHVSYLPKKAFDGVFAVESGRWLGSSLPAFGGGWTQPKNVVHFVPNGKAGAITTGKRVVAGTYSFTLAT